MKHVLFVGLFFWGVQIFGAEGLFEGLDLRLKKCKDRNKEVAQWVDHKNGEDQIPSSKVESAFSILREISYPTEAQISAVYEELKKDPTEVFLKYSSLVNTDCSGLRLFLMKGLTHTASELKPADRGLRDKISAGLKEIFLKPKYSTYINATIEASLMDYGMSRGLWPPSQLNPLTAIRAELKAESKEVSRKTSIEWGRLNKKMDFSKPDQVSSMLKNSPDFLLVKPYLLSEAESAHAFFVRLRKIAESF